MQQNDSHAAYGCICPWYHSITGRAPNPTIPDLKKVSLEFFETFRKQDPTGEPLPYVLPCPFPIPDEPPSDDEIIAAIYQL